MSGRVRPFASDSRLVAWTGDNCLGCRLYVEEEFGHCDIVDALAIAYFAADGMVSEEIGRRMGVAGDETAPEACPERVAREEE